MVTESDVLKCMSDEKSREILTIVHEMKPLSISNLRLTRKQYYSRLHNLIACTLVKKENGDYHLTSFGRVVFDWHLNMKECISKEYWSLAAIDALSSFDIPESERIKMVKSLIENGNVRESLVSSIQK